MHCKDLVFPLGLSPIRKINIRKCWAAALSTKNSDKFLAKIILSTVKFGVQEGWILPLEQMVPIFILKDQSNNNYFGVVPFLDYKSHSAMLHSAAGQKTACTMFSIGNCSLCTMKLHIKSFYKRPVFCWQTAMFLKDSNPRFALKSSILVLSYKENILLQFEIIVFLKWWENIYFHKIIFLLGKQKEID